MMAYRKRGNDEKSLPLLYFYYQLLVKSSDFVLIKKLIFLLFIRTDFATLTVAFYHSPLFGILHLPKRS